MNKNKKKLKRRKLNNIKIKMPNLIPAWENKRGILVSLEKRISTASQQQTKINLEAFKKYNEELNKIEEELNK